LTSAAEGRHEFGVLVWAADLWFDVSENAQRIRDADVNDGVFPFHADARSLPSAVDFFDAIVSMRPTVPKDWLADRFFDIAICVLTIYSLHLIKCPCVVISVKWS
jgi:hypothetical protein